VQCEAIVPDRSWDIPDKDEGERTKVDIALRIANRTGRALYFTPFDTIGMALTSASGKRYGRQCLRDGTRKPTTADYPLVQSGDSVTFPIDAHLYWQGDELLLGGSDGFGGQCLVRGLEPGEYELVLGYTMSKSRLQRDVDVLGEAGAIVMIPKDQVWQAQVVAPPINVTLAAPPEEGHKTGNRVRMDEDRLCQKLEDCYETVKLQEKLRGPAFDMHVELLSYLVLVAGTHASGSKRLDAVFSRIQKESPRLLVPHHVMTPAELEQFIDRLAARESNALFPATPRFMSQWIAQAKEAITARSGFQFDPSVKVIYSQ
jgi:hypothetical protein